MYKTINGAGKLLFRGNRHLPAELNLLSGCNETHILLFLATHVKESQFKIEGEFHPISKSIIMTMLPASFSESKDLTKINILNRKQTG